MEPITHLDFTKIAAIIAAARHKYNTNHPSAALLLLASARDLTTHLSIRLADSLPPPTKKAPR